MEDSSVPVPSISTSGVGSRFVSQDDLERAREKKEEQWKAAYARLGQEPPPVPLSEDTQFDGRSLFEKLQAQKIAREEAWQEQHKLSKQFRALEEDEIRFLEQINAKKYEEEKRRKEEENVELKGFREAVAARFVLPPPPIPSTSSISPSLPSSTSSTSPPKLVQPTAAAKPPKPKVGKKDTKSLLKGVIVKKSERPKGQKPPEALAKVGGEGAKTEGEDEDEPRAKRRKIG